MKHIFKLALLIVMFHITAYRVHAAPLITDITDNRSDYPNAQIPKYRKFELIFDVATIAPNLQFPHLNTTDAGTWLAQYVDQGISIDATFTDPEGNSFNQPAFYYQHFSDEIKSNRSWLYPLSNYDWRVRFSPNRPGNWSYSITATDSSGTTTSSSASFTVIESSHKGFIRVSPTDPRYFEFDDGTKFDGLGYNLGANALLDDTELSSLKNNEVKLIRAWMAPWNIFASSWTSWEMMPGHYDGYLPRVPILPYISDPNDPSKPMPFRWYFSQDSGWFEQCAFIGHTQDSPSVKPNTDYFIRAKYITENITGPRDTSLSSDYGFVLRIGGWAGYCGREFDPDDPNDPDDSYDPNWSYTSAITDYGTSTTHSEIKGIWSSGNNNYLPYLYMALENVSDGTGAKAYIESVEVVEMNGGTVDNPSLIGENIIDKYSPEEHLYMAQRPSYKFDKLIEKIENYDVFIRPVILEKNDTLFVKINEYGNAAFTLDTNGNIKFNDDFNRFYGSREDYATRWLQKAWWRYLQARWGYSPNIHSWELDNEGDPWRTSHYQITDELGKYMHCTVFGVAVGVGDAQKCSFDHPNDHMVSTSNWHSFPKYNFWGNSNYPNVDFADVHRYITKDSATAIHFDAALANKADGEWYQTGLDGFNLDKPIIRGETGLVETGSGPINIDVPCQDQKGVWLHNMLWAGLNPGAMIESFWYVGDLINVNRNFDCDHDPTTANTNVTYDHRPTFKEVSDFIDNIPMSNGEYVDAQAVDGSGISMDTGPIRAWGQKDSWNPSTNQVQPASHAHLWIQNMYHRWGYIYKFIGNMHLSFGPTQPNTVNSMTYSFRNGSNRTYQNLEVNAPQDSRLQRFNHTCPTTLVSGNQCDVTVEFNPGSCTDPTNLAVLDFVEIVYQYPDNNGNLQTAKPKIHLTGMCPQTPLSTEVVLSGFTAGQNYQVEWWDTWNPDPQTRITTTSTQANGNGDITLSVNNLNTDIAVKIGNYENTSPPPLPGDINGSGKVDIFDYTVLIKDFGTSEASSADLDGDGDVDFGDFVKLLQFITS